MAMAAAGILVRPFPGQIPDALDPTGRIENKLGERAVHVFAAQAEKIGVFIVYFYASMIRFKNAKYQVITKSNSQNLRIAFCR